MEQNSDLKLLANLGCIGSGLKTGIYRVTVEIVQGMASTLGPNATFHAVSDVGESHRYFQEFLEPHGSRLYKGCIPKLRAQLSLEFTRFAYESISNRSIHYKIIRRGLTWLNRIADRFSSIFPAEYLPKFSIYHSPFGVIPRQVRQCPNIRRFTTIYDLIPVTHPDYFEQGTIDQIRGILDSLDENDYTLSISAATRADLLANARVSPARAFVVPLAASKHFYPATDIAKNKLILSRHGIGQPGYILSLCTFEIRKNIEAVIRAFSRLHEECLIPQETRLVLVGGKGWKTQNLEASLAEASAVRNLIIMPGFIPDEDLAAIYSSARVFTYMSFMEGFGLPPLEAMQCGTPVITSNTSSLPEVVGNAGVMLDPTDVGGLVAAVSRIYSDDTYHAEQTHKALERASLFSWERHVKETLMAYRQALDDAV